MGLNPYQRDMGIRGYVSGFLAAQISSFCCIPFYYPFTTISRRLQMEAEKPMEQKFYKGNFNCARVIIKNEGYKGLYKGLSVCLVKNGFAALIPLFY
jgi:solute carrier family 25 (adenine nucleotide translocator) protein 4/5/6/31